MIALLAISVFLLIGLHMFAPFVLRDLGRAFDDMGKVLAKPFSRPRRPRPGPRMIKARDRDAALERWIKNRYLTPLPRQVDWERFEGAVTNWLFKKGDPSAPVPTDDFMGNCEIRPGSILQPMSDKEITQKQKAKILEDTLGCDHLGTTYTTEDGMACGACGILLDKDNWR